MENKDDDKVVILRSLVKVQQIKPKEKRKKNNTRVTETR